MFVWIVFESCHSINITIIHLRLFNKWTVNPAVQSNIYPAGIYEEIIKLEIWWIIVLQEPFIRN